MATISKRTGVNGTRYHAKIRLKGYPAQSATFDRLTDARQWAGAVEADMRAGRHIKSNAAKRHTFADAVARYAVEVAPSLPKEWRHRQKHLEWWAGHLGSKTMAELSPVLIGEVRGLLQAGVMADGSQGFKTGADGKKVPKGRSNATVVRYLAALSALMTKAVEWGWLDSNPIEKVSKPALPRGRIRFLDDDERLALLKACKASESTMLYPAVVLALSTGMRQGEQMALKWKDVDLARGRATLMETKNGSIRVVTISGHALELMKAMAKVRRLDSHYIFPSTDGKSPACLRSAWRVALNRAKLVDFKWHDLRHTAASYLAMNQASMLEIAAVLGHKSLQMVQRYSHLSENHAAGVVEDMNTKMFGNS